MIRFLRLACLALAVGCLAVPAMAQTETGTVSGQVTDPSGAVVPRAEVVLLSVDRGTSTTTTTNKSGIYSFAAVQPGQYRIKVTKSGFRQVDLLGILVNVQANIEQNFRLAIGSTSESVTVQGGTPTINAQDGTVSTVIGRKFLEDIPMNGRTFQTLLMLTPGVQFDNDGNCCGTFSVNGQRNDANYFTVDGVAANIAATPATGYNGLTGSGAGTLAGFNEMGGTNSLISVDAVQEFRVQTSTFSPEYGRSPGAQVGIVSRSGTNEWHGTAFDYLRNNIFDANDWFSDSEGLPKPEERQNDFGGVFGGPVRIPHLYNGKDRTFFFFSYEGLRLRQPVNILSYVPDRTVRSQVPAALQPFINAFPIPNGPEVGGSMAEYYTGASDPSTMDAYSLRLDQAIGSRFRLFGRYDYSPNTTGTFGAPPSTGVPANQESLQRSTMHTLTLGLDEMVTSTMSNELRLNYSNDKAQGWSQLAAMGGAVPLSNAELSQIAPPGVDPSKAKVGFFVLSPVTGFVNGPTPPTEQRQVNVVDNVSLVRGPHQMKFGVDYRWLAPLQAGQPFFEGADYLSMTGVVSNRPLIASAQRKFSASLRTKEFSLYAQDTWMATPRLTLTYGLRWDVDPAPQGANLASDPIVVEGTTDPATMTLTPPGTPFYQTTWDNIAPRLGVAYQLRTGAGWETVLRGGVGTFYQTGAGNLGFYTYDLLSSQRITTFPMPPQQIALSSSRTFPPPPPYPGGEMSLTNLLLPRTYEWDFALEQSLGRNQTLTLTYVGNLGRELLRGSNFYNNGVNPNFLPNAFFEVTGNSGFSDYQGLQVQFQRQAARGLDAIASYTYSHAIDNASDPDATSTPTLLGNGSFDKGNSAFDVRHSASGALVYSIPAPFRSGFARAVLGGWSVDDLVVARTAFPIDMHTSLFFGGPTDVYEFDQRPNIVPGVPFYLYGSQYPGGKRVNPAAFTKAAPGAQGNLGRNVIRGFGAWQDNFAIHRQFNLSEKVNLQFRAEAFNLLNHPNFYDPNGFMFGGPTDGESTATLADGLYNQGGLNALYQVGAPRSWQFALRLAF